MKKYYLKYTVGQMDDLYDDLMENQLAIAIYLELMELIFEEKEKEFKQHFPYLYK